MRKDVPIQSLIDHIKTSLDVDPWAKEIAEELLKRQEPSPQEREGGGSSWWYVCPECHGAIGYKDAYCKHCGQAVKWDA